MRLTLGLALSLVLLAGCGQTPSKPALKPTPSAGGDKTDAEISKGGGEIVKPVSRPAVPPSPAEDALSKLSAAQLVQELGKPEARDVASKLLVSRKEGVVNDLVAGLKDENWQVRAGVVFTLGRLGKAAEPAVPELKRLLETEPHEAVKDAIVFCLDAIEGN